MSERLTQIQRISRKIQASRAPVATGRVMPSETSAQPPVPSQLRIKSDLALPTIEVDVPIPSRTLPSHKRARMGYLAAMPIGSSFVVPISEYKTWSNMWRLLRVEFPEFKDAKWVSKQQNEMYTRIWRIK